MRGESLILSLATATSLLSSAVESLELVKKSSPAVVGFEIARNHVTNPVTRDRMRWKRDTKTVEQELDNEVCFHSFFFLAPVGVGDIVLLERILLTWFYPRV